jgi:hypothetical protein
MTKSIIAMYNNLLAIVTSKPLSQVLPLALQMARALGNKEFEKWARLEINGYFDTNPSLDDSTIVPKYRTVCGQHSDEYGRPLVIQDPTLQIINEDRLRYGVAELEKMEKRDEALSIQNPYTAKLIYDHLKVKVITYSFSPIEVTGVLSGIRTELLDWLNKICIEKSFATSELLKNTDKEDEIKPKPPEFLEKLLWILKIGPKHWKLLLLAIFLLFLWGDFIWPKFNLLNRFYHPAQKILDNDWETPLQARTKKRINDIYKKIEDEKLNPWLIINTGAKLQITKYDGEIISYEGGTFEGARVIFWSDDFIPPFIEDAIIKVFDQTIEECRKNNLDPKPYISEARSLLFGFIYNVYSRMADIDQKLCSKGHSEKVGRKDVSYEINKMKECLRKHYDAAVLLVSKDGNLKNAD